MELKIPPMDFVLTQPFGVPPVIDPKSRSHVYHLGGYTRVKASKTRKSKRRDVAKSRRGNR